LAQGATIAFGLQASTLRTDRQRRCTEVLWCKWRGPVGNDQAEGLRRAVQGAALGSSISPDERTLYDFHLV
jgi:hypothetical protein